jgi:8-oxo-dGTP diphosphatase
MENTEKEFLRNYNPNDYKKPSVTCDICICTIKDNTLQLLLIKRKYPPFQNSFSLPGGFLEIDKEETLEETAKRELEEETGLKDIYFEQLKTYGDPERDPRMRVITVAYFALVPYDKLNEIKAGDDAKEAKWFDINKLPPLAFDHKTIIKDLKERLRGKISYSPIAFELVPNQFSWTELQKVYEIVLNKVLLAPNFRRDIKRIYNIKSLKTKGKLTSSGRRPHLFEFMSQKVIF